MIRAAALALLVLVSVAMMLPLVDSSAHNNRPTASRSHHMGHHSRAWWRRHRARLRRLRAAQQRKESLQAMRGQSLNTAAESHTNMAARDQFSGLSNERKNRVNA